MVTKSKNSLLITKQRLSNGAVKGRGSGCCSIQHFTLDSAGIWCYFCESTATSGAANGGAVPSTGTLLRLGRLRPGFGAPGKLSSGEFSANDAARGARAIPFSSPGHLKSLLSGSVRKASRCEIALDIHKQDFRPDATK